MISEPTGTALLYSGGMLTDLHGKTSHGLLRYSKRFQILGVVDHKHAGQMSNEIVSNCQDDVPIFSDINKAIEGLGKKPDFLVHMTYASKSDLKLASKQTSGIVVCPRANASLAEGIPNVVQMMKMNCNVAIGTDNVMINSPDLFREMDFLWKVTMGINQKRIEPKNILKMTTVNAGKLLGKKIGCIKEGYLADAVFIKKNDLDLDPLRNPHASIVHRANENSIQAVMIGGNIVHGKL